MYDGQEVRPPIATALIFTYKGALAPLLDGLGIQARESRSYYSLEHKSETAVFYLCRVGCKLIDLRKAAR